MIAYNKTDICVGSAWSLPERHAMSQYIYSWESDQIYLISYASQIGGNDLLAGIFLPFKAEVWLVLGLTVIATVF
eukprot:scaffold500262_cov42-Prasinocladus_malaysianus.AAC.1